jgi:Ser/Thr protein kinase RdoA (MazF antagonist)
MDPSRAQSEATRLLPLAQRALERYPFLTREVTHLATHSNVLFRVLAESGEQMVLRVGTPHGNTRSNIEVEVAWLDALDRETALEVVKPIRTSSGTMIVDEYDEHIDKERSCVLFSWIPGQPMADGSGSFAYRLLGAMAASLQAHGAAWTPPEHVDLRVWDRVFYYQDFDPVIIENPLYSHLFDVPRVTTINTAIELAEEVISDSYATTPRQIVHGDLHEWNVHLAGSRLYAFDFEDVMMALPAQDVATCLYSSRNSDVKEQIRAAFRRGYESILPWPVIDERQLDGFHAARQVMLMNYAGRTLPMTEAADFIDQVMPWLQGYVKRYG